jgi:hypothetical protein
MPAFSRARGHSSFSGNKKGRYARMDNGVCRRQARCFRDQEERGKSVDFEELGGFNEDLKYNEDTDFCHRAIKKGYKIVYSPMAVVEHFMGLDSYQETARFVKKYGLERGRNIRKNPYLFQKFNVLSMLFLFSIAFLLVTALVSHVSQLVLYAVTASLSGVIMAYSARIAVRTRSLTSFGYSILIFCTIHVNYNLGLFSGLLRGEPKKNNRLSLKNSAEA